MANLPKAAMLNHVNADSGICRRSQIFRDLVSYIFKRPQLLRASPTRERLDALDVECVADGNATIML
jgi:hypothetical protein